VFTEYGDLITRFSDIEERIAYATETGHALTLNIVKRAELTEAGFVLAVEEQETGWHPGQDASPADVEREIRSNWPDAEVVHLITGSGQFDTTWSTYYRTTEQEH